ncbi:MAG TPA: hypothetical protein PKK12_13925 [Candidatus Aminicenantes bacterium]|nr:hypothetical protein [Candidatus Aminicenantes bacterium]
MNRIPHWLCFGLLLTVASLAWPADESYARATRLLATGHAAEALPLFTQVAATSRQGPVWYNLGNCLRELGQPVWAKVAYLRAEKYLPGDAAVGRNLALLRARFPTPADPGPEGSWLAFCRELRHHLPPRVLALIVLLAAWAAATLLWGWLLRRRRPLFYGLVFFLVLGLAAAGTMALEREAVTRITRGVVIQPDAELLSAPETGATVLFTLPAGQEVRWIERRGDWLSVAASAQMAGWTEIAGVEGI